MNRISVVIPVYNAESTIISTLESIIPQQKLINEIFTSISAVRSSVNQIAKRINSFLPT